MYFNDKEKEEIVGVLKGLKNELKEILRMVFDEEDTTKKVDNEREKIMKEISITTNSLENKFENFLNNPKLSNVKNLIKFHNLLKNEENFFDKVSGNK